MIASVYPYATCGDRVFMTKVDHENYWHQVYLEDLKKKFETERTAFVNNDECCELSQLLDISKNGDRDSFIGSLKWVALCSYGEPKSTVFVFPETLSKEDRLSIHRLGLKNKLGTKTLFGKLHVFIKTFD